LGVKVSEAIEVAVLQSRAGAFLCSFGVHRSAQNQASPRVRLTLSTRTAMDRLAKINSQACRVWLCAHKNYKVPRITSPLARAAFLRCSVFYVSKERALAVLDRKSFLTAVKVFLIKIPD